MRVFHSLVLDENLEAGTSTSTIIYTDASWNSQMGLPDKLTIFALTDTVVGAGTGTPALTVQIEESPDQVHFLAKSGTPEIQSTTTLSTNANTLAVGRDAGTVPSAAFIRLKTTLSSSVAGAKAHVRLWVTGRGEQIP